MKGAEDVLKTCPILSMVMRIIIILLNRGKQLINYSKFRIHSINCGMSV